MHSNDNFFKQHKLILTIFILAFIAFLITGFLFHTGAFFDIPAQFFATNQPLLNYDSHQWLTLSDGRTRNLSNLLLTIPYNIALSANPKNILTMLGLFTASYHITNFSGLLLNYIIALRTKRFDIATLSLLFFSFFVIPNSIWATREIHIATMLQFCLLSYFLSSEKLKKIDIIPISLLVLYQFESFETSILIGLLFFTASLFYLKNNKNDSNIKIKLYIGISGLITALYIPFQTINLSNNKVTGLDLNVSLQQWISGAKVLQEHMWHTCFLITFGGIVASILLFFHKKNIDLKDLKYIIPFGSIAFLVLLKYTRLIPYPDIELQLYILTVILIAPFIISIIIFDYLQIDFKFINKHFFSNILLLSCIVGITHYCWQINSSIHFKNYTDDFKTLINKSNTPIERISDEKMSNEFLNFSNCFGDLHRSLLFSPEFKVKTLIFPDNTSSRYHQFCFDGTDKTYYDEKDDYVVLQTTELKVKTKYWDMSEIAKEFKKQNRTNTQ